MEMEKAKKIVGEVMDKLATEMQFINQKKSLNSSDVDVIKKMLEAMEKQPALWKWQSRQAKVIPGAGEDIPCAPETAMHPETILGIATWAGPMLTVVPMQMGRMVTPNRCGRPTASTAAGTNTPGTASRTV